MRKPELLAPAGEYAGLVGAIAAGADAVYLGGERFGARAYAKNFTDEELLRGLRFAHLRGRRVYLTLNTLIKEREFAALETYLEPLDEAGLDGIIVQDPGVFSFVRERFPRIRLHASTQMAVTGAYGARLLKAAGASRVVPARELSLDELVRMKRATDDGDGGIEIEAFIHGAMCYSYSGMCLFSAMLGGRSGNRGRCAGACRLPYTAEAERGRGERIGGGSRGGEMAYPLSLRDLCTLPILKRILLPGGAGQERPLLDSLKIEGRMKDPVYTAGVTAVYRKAIDAIWADPAGAWEADAADLAALKGLYLRSDLCDGYYFRHNGRQMVTASAPGYIGSDEAATARVREKYLRQEPKLPVSVRLAAREGEPLALTLTAGTKRRGRGDGTAPDGEREEISVTLRGETLMHADRHAAEEGALRKQLDRFGESDFAPVSVAIDLAGEPFVPASALNALRREACEALAQRILGLYGERR